jgi:hypothetical protein
LLRRFVQLKFKSQQNVRYSYRLNAQCLLELEPARPKLKVLDRTSPQLDLFFPDEGISTTEHTEEVSFDDSCDVQLESSSKSHEMEGNGCS